MKDTIIMIMLFATPVLIVVALEWTSRRDHERRRQRDREYLRQLGAVLAAVDGRPDSAGSYGRLIAATFTEAAQQAREKR